MYSWRGTYVISTVWIELTSSVILGKTNTGLVEMSGDLDISTGPHELDISERARRHNTSAMTRLSAVAIAHRLLPR